jgi:endonuclease YncB( thermonuclease family)
MTKRGKFVEFKPARRVFAGRGRSLLTFGEWKIATAALAIGAVIGAGWLDIIAPEETPPRLAATSPAPTSQAVSEPTPLLKPVPAQPVIDAQIGSDEAGALPQIILANEDGRRSRTAEPASDYQGSVSRVVDGDTFYLEGLRTRIRLWGIDAPERDEPVYVGASDELARLVSGEDLSCEHMEFDKYERIVARCRLGDGSDISERMIDSGTAEEFLRFTQGYYAGE